MDSDLTWKSPEALAALDALGLREDQATADAQVKGSIIVDDPLAAKEESTYQSRTLDDAGLRPNDYAIVGTTGISSNDYANQPPPSRHDRRKKQREQREKITIAPNQPLALEKVFRKRRTPTPEQFFRDAIKAGAVEVIRQRGKPPIYRFKPT